MRQTDQRPCRVRARRRGRERGFTLIEFLIVVALLGLMAALGIRGFRSFTRSDLRTASGRLAGAMRYLFDRASTTGKVHRLVFDFDNGKYWAEVSDDRFFLPREREDEEARQRQYEELERRRDEAALRAEKGLAPEDEAEDEEGKGGLGFGFGATAGERYTVDRYLPKPYKPRPSRFKPFKETIVKPVKLDDDVRLHSLYTPRLTGPIGNGQGYVYFFPLGFAEAGIVHLTDDKQEHTYSLVVHPLTGRVRIFDEYVEPPVEQLDDEGNGYGAE